MDSTYPESRRPSRDKAGNGFVEGDINIPHRGMLQSARRLQETKALLTSPGPLESMLKTTTETGDIGLYSVGPSRSSSHSRTALHPTATAGGSRLARTMSMNAAPERRQFRDGRRGLPSQRDTSSEILAFYGPNEHRPMPALFSRSPDDAGPRSYSLTSCSSRYMSDQKSTETWDSRSSGGSGGVLPRARSPYPYHTRLKRPGVRPSSPAVTLDGAIDYSRMVEIDRTSYRTIHGPYGRSYPRNPPRHPHSRPRPLGNHVAQSLPGDVDTFMLSQHRSAAATPGSPCVNHARDQVASVSSDQSAHVSSITSIVQMYASPAAQSAVRQPPIPSSGSFYYDYSEDFHEPSEPAPCESVPVMPKRPPSTHQSLVRDSSCGPVGSTAASVDDAAPTRPPCIGPASSTRSCTEPEARPSKLQHQSDEEYAVHADTTVTPTQTGTIVGDDAEVLPYVASDQSESGGPWIFSAGSESIIVGGTESGSSHLDSSQAHDTTASEKKQEQPQADSVRIVVSNTPTLASDAPTRTSVTHSACDHSKTEDDAVGDSIADMSPQTPSAATDSSASRGSELTRQSSAYPDTPSVATRRRSNVYSLQPGLLDLKAFVHDLDEAGLLHDAGASEDPVGSSRLSNAPAKAPSGANVHALLARTSKVLEAESKRIGTYGNMRESGLSSAITRLKTDVVPGCRQSTDDSESVILAPQPVSPARQLRLRSSVSKLMKALPPIPSGTEQEATASKPFAERKLPALPTALQVSLSSPGQTSAIPERGLACASNSQEGVPSTGLQGNPDASRAGNKRSSRDIHGDIWDMHFGTADDSAGGIGEMQSSSTIAPDMMKQTEGTSFSGSGTRQLHPSAQRDNFKTSTARSKPIAREICAHLNFSSQRRGSSLDTSRGTFQKPEVPPQHSTPVSRGGFVDQTRPHKGLTRRLSDFKIRLTASRHRGVNWLSPGVGVDDDSEVIGIAVPVTSSTVSPESGGVTSNSNSAAGDASARRLRYKLSRWMKSAKNTVNSCKRLSSSTGGTSLDTDF